MILTRFYQMQDQYPLTIATMPSLRAVQQSIIDDVHPKIRLDPMIWTEQRARNIGIERYRCVASYRWQYR